MKRISFIIAAVIVSALGMGMSAQLKLNKQRILGGAAKVVQAATLSDEQMAQYVSEYIKKTDELNHVLPESDSLVIRLNRLVDGITSVEGIPLNFKVYNVVDVNAFACPDGSIRVFAGLMDVVTDDELLGVIGHEIGHIAHRDSKNAFKRSLMTSALKDGIASVNGKAAALTDSQLSALGESLMTATFSQKQEKAADDYGYDFLKSHGKNPVAMAKSFYKLKEMEESAGVQKSSKINQLFSSHPDLDLRIERMEERARKDGYMK